MEPTQIDDACDTQPPPALRLRPQRVARDFEAVLGHLYAWVMAEPVPPRLLAILRGTPDGKT